MIIININAIIKNKNNNNNNNNIIMIIIIIIIIINFLLLAITDLHPCHLAIQTHPGIEGQVVSHQFVH